MYRVEVWGQEEWLVSALKVEMSREAAIEYAEALVGRSIKAAWSIESVRDGLTEADPVRVWFLRRIGPTGRPESLNVAVTPVHPNPA